MKRVVKGIAVPWVAGVEIESRKKKKEDTRATESEDNVATVPRQRRQKACWYFVTSRINPQAHEYRCSFHPRVFQGIVSTEECEYAIYGFGLIQGHTRRCGEDRREDFLYLESMLRRRDHVTVIL